MVARPLWSLAGALVVFGLLAILTIGLPFLVLGLALIVVLSRRRGVDVGPLLGGVGLVLLATGALNFGLALGTVLLGLGAAALVAGRVGCHRRAA